MRCLAFALLFAAGMSVGVYALAPDGAYNNYAIENVSHDPRRYLWGIVFPRAWPLLGLHAAIIFVPFGICAVAAATVLALLCTRIWPNSGLWLNKLPTPALYWGTGMAGFLAGVIQTIYLGKNPGII